MSLSNKINELNCDTKYGLVWEQYSEAVIEDCLRKTPILVEDTSKEIITHISQEAHMLIEGDNYHALCVLNQTHRQKIDLIYIDPPYNTGKKSQLTYTDKYMNNNDVYKHSRWLSFMDKRLRLAKNLLSEKGVIFISIDDNEVAPLKLLCNSIFGEENFIAQFVRKNKTGAGHDSKWIAIEYDYMFCYARNKHKVVFEKQTIAVENDTKYKFKDNHFSYRGKYYLRDLAYKGTYNASADFPIRAPDDSMIYAGGELGKPTTWRWSKDKVKWGIENDFIVFKKRQQQWKVYIKQYQFVNNKNEPYKRKLPFRGLIEFLNAEGSQELKQILPQHTFKFPKPTELVRFCIQLFKDKEIRILDFFAGSGTTGHAVLKANSQDKGNRKFIVCTNNENNICQEITYPRLQKVIQGYTNAKGKQVEGMKAHLKYFKTAFT
ncbi:MULTISPECIES: site-specific DNA-methyltransferase [Capnocytophaga]|uniref:site-specific DNA-methyltransferase n=2 Tax=Flavobacteriaceae TaxID=49546 RepID=UPI00370DC26D